MLASPPYRPAYGRGCQPADARLTWGACATLVDERAKCSGDVAGGQGSEPERPRPVELLAELVGHADAFELLLVLLGSPVARLPLECGVETVAAVIHRPDRDPIGDRSRVDGKQLIRHGSKLIGRRFRQLDSCARAPSGAVRRGGAVAGYSPAGGEPFALAIAISPGK